MHGERIHGNFDITFHLHVPHIPLLGGISMQVKGNYTVHVNPAPTAMSLTPAGGAFPDETVGQAATGGVQASGGTPPYKFTVSAGSLPPGVLLDANTGQLLGSPTVSGDGPVEITASDVNG